ncbi:alpha/beta hydrolase [Amycolatopsis minnesotensis]
MTEELMKVGGIDLCYETFGDRGARPLLLVMGLGGQMTWWEDEFCEQLAERDFFVIRFDNRDTGRSTALHGRSSLVKSYLLRSSPYPLTEMADDAAGLLQALDVPAAHVAGVSMGGMICQSLAIRHPGRVRSLTSIMSTTGSRRVGLPHPKVLSSMLAAPPKDRDGYAESLLRTFRTIGSPGFPFDEPRLRARALRSFDRGLNAAGTARHLSAILAAGDRTPGLRELRIPALVIHGARDPLVNPSGGKATAKAIPGAELDLVPGMGHDMPREVWPRLIDGIARTAGRAGS